MPAEKSLDQQILEQVSTLTLSLANHVAGQVHTDVMTASMYKIIVTGNGVPPLPEIVRRHDEWIKERDLDIERERQERNRKAEEIKQEHRQDTLISSSDAKKDRSEAVGFKRQLWIMIGTVVGTQLIGFAFLAFEIFLHMK